jgi:RNA-binding protein YlmH
MLQKHEFIKLFYDIDHITASRLYDLASRCLDTAAPQFTEFHDQITSQNIYNALSENSRLIDREFCVLYHNESHERRMLGLSLGPITPADFPVDCLRITYTNPLRVLSHRDFLGSIMSLGIDRAKVGDIVVSEGEALVFAHSRVSGDISLLLAKVANTSVSIEKIEPDNGLYLPNIGEYRYITVDSLRADAVLCAIFRLPRSQMKELADKGKIFINWREASGTRQVKKGDVITLRGHGRAQISEIVQTKTKLCLTVEVNV